MSESATAEVVATKPKKAVPAASTGNLFLDVAKQVENLKKPDALKLADELATSVETNYFRLGGVLGVILKNTWFEGYETFEAFVYDRYGFQKRKAFYLIQIYTDLVDKQIPWDKLAGLGWTKIKDLAPYLTLDNVDDWVAKAKTLTVLELQAALKAKPGDTTTTETKDNVLTLKFKVHGDQLEVIQSALNKAKAELQSDYDAVALENICQAFLAGGGAVGDVKQLVQALGVEGAFALFAEIWPDVNVEVTT